MIDAWSYTELQRELGHAWLPLPPRPITLVLWTKGRTDFAGQDTGFD